MPDRVARAFRSPQEAQPHLARPASRLRSRRASPPPSTPPACVVPKLKGKTLKRAKAALRAAHCKLGTVHKPKRAKGKRRRVLVVKSSSPRRGAKPADGTVDLKLRVKPKRTHR